ncbi:MAG TPA: hypothetical protein VM266_10435 [Solirubrobacteraceae bacterium]|nr:hypothetical protein [Solirubrobacteraceae bacterium]
MTHPLAARLLPHEVRMLAGVALVVAAAYGVFIAVFGVGLTVDCSLNPEHCDGKLLWPPAIGAAGVVALGAICRALPALRTAVRTGDRGPGPFRRFGVAWLAALLWGALTFWPGAVQILYTALALPVVVAFFAVSRAAVALDGARAATPPRRRRFRRDGSRSGPPRS